MILILLVVLVLVLGGVFVFAVFGGLLKVESDQKKAENNADQILDSTFDGSANVIFKTHARTLKYETVVLGAQARGYKLVHQADGQYGPHTLIFEKTPETTNSPASNS